MTIRPISSSARFVVVAVLAVAATACASAPSKSATPAATDTAGAPRAAEARGNDSWQASTKGGLAEDGHDKSIDARDRERGLAKLQEAREQYRSDALERFERANARVVAAQQELEAAGSRAPAATRRRVEAAAAQRTAVSQQISGLSMVSQADWARAMKGVDARLQELEALLDAR